MAVAAADIIDRRRERQVLIIFTLYRAQKRAEVRQVAQLQVKEIFFRAHLFSLSGRLDDPIGQRADHWNGANNENPYSKWHAA